MQTLLFTMVILVTGSGGPAVMPGFVSRQACEAARPMVEAAFWDMMEVNSNRTVRSRCVAVGSGY